MPRSNRSRSSRRGNGPSPSDEPADFGHLTSGWRRTDTKFGRDWTVQPIGSESAVKTYRCPGCANPIEPGTAHLVVWQQDGILGDEADLAARRHWHSHCWRVS